MKKKRDLTMLLYAVIMTLLFLIEWFVTYKSGMVSYMLYAITPVRFFICRYMVHYFCKRMAGGEDFHACIRDFQIMSFVYAMDFLVNLVLTVPFPRSFIMESYVFFAGITILEFALNAYVLWEYSRFYEWSNSTWWFLINLIMTAMYIMIAVKNLGEYEISDIYTFFLFILFLFREPLKISITLLKEAPEANDTTVSPQL